MTISPIRVPIGTGSPTRDVARTPAMLGTSNLVALGIAMATAYAFVASDPYRSLPAATVLTARGQDVVSVLVAGLLAALVVPVRVSPLRLLVWVGLLGRVLRPTTLQWPDTASNRLRRGTGWMLAVVAMMVSGLGLSVVVPFALEGNAPSPQGAGGTTYPVFVLDLVVVLPALAAVGVLLLRRHRLGAPFAVLALAKLLTLFRALWAGPAYALVTGVRVALGPRPPWATPERPDPCYAATVHAMGQQ
jgi:hypothetical protein